MAIADVVENNNLKERFSIGGGCFADIVNLITLVVEVKASGTHGTPRIFGVASGYTPAAGKQFRMIGIDITPAGGGDGVGLQTASTDVGFNSASAPATPDFGSGIQNLAAVIANSALATFENELILPAGRYFYFTSGATLSAIIYGYEEPIV